MNRTTIALITAASIAAFSGAASAQSMSEGISMLEAAVTQAFTQLGVTDVPMESLTLGQLALIQNVVNSDDTTTEKRRRIEAIINR